jgi:hypothetical protein
MKAYCKECGGDLKVSAIQAATEIGVKCFCPLEWIPGRRIPECWAMHVPLVAPEPLLLMIDNYEPPENDSKGVLYAG